MTFYSFTPTPDDTKEITTAAGELAKTFGIPSSVSPCPYHHGWTLCYLFAHNDKSFCLEEIDTLRDNGKILSIQFDKYGYSVTVKRTTNPRP